MTIGVEYEQCMYIILIKHYIIFLSIVFDDSKLSHFSFCFIDHYEC